MPYYANFALADSAIKAVWRGLGLTTPLLVRHDTRVYLHDSPTMNPVDVPIACVVALNPGSAKPKGELGVLGTIKSDLTLRTIRDVYRQACVARRRTIQPDTFVRVFNLSYAVTSNPVEMLAIEDALDRAGLAIPPDPAETAQLPDATWYAWGISTANDPVMTALKGRFYRTPAPTKACWADAGVYTPGLPSATNKIWHPRAFATRPTLRAGFSQAIVL